MRKILVITCGTAALHWALLSQAPQPGARSTASTPSTPSTAAESKSLEPTEVQKLKLENAQLKAQLAFVQLKPIQDVYQQRIEEFFEVCELVKKENGWDKKVTCSPQTLNFSPPPKDETPAGKSSSGDPGKSPPAEQKK